MSNLRELKKSINHLSKETKTHKENMKAALELMQKGKIAKPEILFRNTVQKIRQTERYEFLYLDMGQKTYFLLDEVFPMGEELEDKIEATKKLITKEDDPEEKELLELLLFFYEELEDIEPKGFATGICQLSRTVKNEETGQTEYYMAIRPTSLELEGTVRRSTLVGLVNEELDYTLEAKRGGLIFLEALGSQQQKEEEEVAVENNQNKEPEATVNNSQQEEAPPPKEARVNKRIQSILKRFKAANSNHAYKRLGLLYKMTALVNSLENPSEKFQKFALELEEEKKELTPLLSEQIEQELAAAHAKVASLSTIDSADQLEKIYGRVEKMYAGWDRFLEGQVVHPKGSIIQELSQELDLLQVYEDKIVPLRTQHQGMTDANKKEELRLKINALIQEAMDTI